MSQPRHRLSFLKTNLAMTEERIAERLAAAVQTGELPSDYSPEQGAHDAVNAILSLAAPARLGSSRDDLIGDAGSATAMVLGIPANGVMAGALNRRADPPGDGGSLGKALDVIGNRSALLILREALCGTTRFGEFAQRAGISEPVTAARLRELVSHGLLEREEIGAPGSAPPSATGLTAKGAELLPALVALMQWSDRWFDEPAGGLD